MQDQRQPRTITRHRPPADAARTGPRREMVWFAAAVNVVVGLLLVASPWVYGFSHDNPATLNRIVVGGVLVVLALLRFVTPITPSAWLSWLVAAFGVWVVISPWAFGYTGVSYTVWNSLILGVIVIVTGTWSAVAGGARPWV